MNYSSAIRQRISILSAATAMIVVMVWNGSSLTAQSVANSSAFGESVDLNILPLLGSGIPVSSGPLPRINGTAAPAYSRSDSVASASVSTPLTGQLLRTGLIEVSAASDMPGATSTRASAVVNGTALTLGQLIPLLSLNAQVIRSSASIDGTCGTSLTASGTTGLVGVGLGGSLGLGVSVPVNPAPNTILLDVAGVRIVLNEQVRTGDGVNNQGITVSAVHVRLRNSLLSGLGVLTGDIYISQSQAGVQCPSGPAPAPQADLSLSGSGTPNPVAPGGRLTYSFNVVNQGPQAATSVVLHDSLPSGLSGVSASASQGACGSGSPILCNLGNIPAGQSVNVTIAGTVSATSGTLTNVATVSSTVSDPNSAGNSLTLTNQVSGGTGPAPMADLSLSGSATPNPVASGGRLTYSIRVTNQGPQAATSVVLNDSLPSGLGGVSASPSQGSCSSGSPIVCNLGSIAAGQGVNVAIAGTVTATSGILTNIASVSSAVADPNSAGNSLTLTNQVSGGSVAPTGAELALVATADPATIQEGQNTRVTFRVINRGPSTATGVTLSGPLGPRIGLQSVTASQGSCSTNGSLSCNLGTLASGQEATVILTIRPEAQDRMRCEATATSSVPDPDLSNNSATATIEILGNTTAPPLADSGACRIDVVPAATLLFPYFEVDLDHANGATTLISVNNASPETQLAQVTIWSDWGIPSLSFTIELSGYDVQTLNLRDILVRSVLPPAPSQCSGQGSSLSKAVTDHLQAWFSGKRSPSQGTCASSVRRDNMATGYITVDAVNRCSSSNPTQAGYFAAGGTGIASNNNVLWGDYFLTNGDEFQAHGDPAVHILALRDTFHGRYSFYGSFVNGSGIDDRQPLGTSYGSRYVSGGLFDGGTQLIVWRDPKVARPAALPCGQEPERMELTGMIYDEEEAASVLPLSTLPAPWSTQKVVLGQGSFPLPYAFGWVKIDLWHTKGSQFGGAAQGWVTTVMSARQRFSIGLRAVRLDSACDF